MYVVFEQKTGAMRIEHLGKEGGGLGQRLLGECVRWRRFGSTRKEGEELPIDGR
jgi:hypothetical protein